MSMRIPIIITTVLLLLGCSRTDRLPSSQMESLYTTYDKGRLSIDELNKALDSAVNQKNKPKEGVIRLSIGKKLRNSSQFDKAMQMNMSAQKIAYELSDTLMIIKSYNEIGTLYRRIDALNEAIKAHYKALHYCEQYSDTKSFLSRKQKASALNGIGNISLILKFYDKAEESFRESIKIETELKSDIGVAINYANIGAIYDAKNMQDSAMLYYNRSLDLNTKAKSKIGISLCHSYIGNIYEKQDQLEKAKEYYIKGYESIKENRDTWHKLVLQTSIARILIKQENYDKGINELSEAQKLAEGISSHEHLAIIHELWADYYEKIGKTTLAIQNLKQSYEYADIDSRNKEQESLMQTNINLLTDISNEQARLQNETIEQHKRRQSMLYLTVSICIIALVVFSYLLYLVRSRNRRLIEVNAMKNRLFSIISHDIKNPLTSQKTVLELMVNNMDYLSADDVKKQCDDLLRSSGALLNLLHNLLHWSQIESKTLRFNPTNIDLFIIASEIDETFNITMQQKQITTQIAIKENTIAYADHNMIRTVLRNLIYNAMKYSHVGSTILLSVDSANDAEWDIKIQDFGVGMSQQTKENLFKLDGSHSNVGTSGEVGTGMGLIIVKEMLTLSGSKMNIESTEGEGTTISFTVKKRR